MTIEDIKSKKLILFEAIAGSKSFGLATEKSDTDIKGVFYLPKREFYTHEYIPQISNDTNDIVYYELGRFIELLLKNNPNIMELLATPDDCILYKHPIMDKIKMSDFLSKLCKDSFAGYASTQIKKARGLNKKIVNPIPKERKNLLHFCTVMAEYKTLSLLEWLKEKKIKQENCGLASVSHIKNLYSLYHDCEKKYSYQGIIKSDRSNEVSLTSIPRGEKMQIYMYCNQEGYSKYCKEYNEYWEWVEKRNEERYLNNQKHGKAYDSKNMMHTLRLLYAAKQILEEECLQIRVKNREELLLIKSGAKEYEELLALAEEIMEAIEVAYIHTNLPERPNYDKAKELLFEMRCILYDKM